MTAGQALAQAQVYLGNATDQAISGNLGECQVRALLAIAYLLDAIAVELGVPELPAPQPGPPAGTSTAPA